MMISRPFWKKKMAKKERMKNARKLKDFKEGSTDFIQTVRGKQSLEEVLKYWIHITSLLYSELGGGGGGIDI